nr:hypothetical protein [uncultured Cupriavidus sp.]
MHKDPHPHTGDVLSTSELLHRIRACVKDVTTQARREDNLEQAVQQRLDRLLRNAIASQSLSEIAVALGSAAELRIFPEASVLEGCTEALRTSRVSVLRALVWTVRHRHTRHMAQLRRAR